MSLGDRFSAQTTKMLIDAGWLPQRNVEAELALPCDFEIFPSALEALREFGNLTVGENRMGVETQQEVLEFDPSCAEGDWKNFKDTATYYGVEALYPLGKALDSGCFLGIDPGGRVFSFGVGESYIAGSFDLALEVLLLGMISWPISANPVEEREKLRLRMRGETPKS